MWSIALLDGEQRVVSAPEARRVEVAARRSDEKKGESNVAQQGGAPSAFADATCGILLLALERAYRCGSLVLSCLPLRAHLASRASPILGQRSDVVETDEVGTPGDAGGDSGYQPHSHTLRRCLRPAAHLVARWCEGRPGPREADCAGLVGWTVSLAWLWRSEARRATRPGARNATRMTTRCRHMCSPLCGASLGVVRPGVGRWLPRGIACASGKIDLGAGRPSRKRSSALPVDVSTRRTVALSAPRRVSTLLAPRATPPSGLREPEALFRSVARLASSS